MNVKKVQKEAKFKNPMCKGLSHTQFSWGIRTRPQKHPTPLNKGDPAPWMSTLGFPLYFFNHPPGLLRLQTHPNLCKRHLIVHSVHFYLIPSPRLIDSDIISQPGPQIEHPLVFLGGSYAIFAQLSKKNRTSPTNPSISCLLIQNSRKWSISDIFAPYWARGPPIEHLYQPEKDYMYSELRI